MRTMNYSLIIASLFLMGSCSKDTPTENEDLAAVEYRSRTNQKEQKEIQEVFELDLRQYYVLGQIADLEKQKRELEEEIEGGNDRSVPNMESIIKQIRTQYNLLDEILVDTCTLLELRYQFLRSLGTPSALDEILKIEQKLQDCGIDVESYLNKVFEGHPIMYIMSWGSRCSPDVEWKCKNTMNGGKWLLNIEEQLANRTELRFKSATGEEISTGRRVENHTQLRGVAQFEIQLSTIEKGVLEISTDNVRYEVPVEIK